jgi:hypothetical protein
VVPHTVLEGFGACVQVLVPLQVRFRQAVGVQVTAVPWHAPPTQASL